MALRIVSMAARGSMGLVQSGEGRMALAASKPTAITYRWASLDEGTFMGMYGCMPAAAPLAFFLPFPLLWGFCLLDTAS